MDDQALSQLISTAVALTGELAELRTELVEVRKELGELRRSAGQRGRRHVANCRKSGPKKVASVHRASARPECELTVREPLFLTRKNAKEVTSQEWRWCCAEAGRLGVPVGGKGRKRMIDLAAFRAALAKDAAQPEEREADDNDPVSALRRELGYRLREKANA